MRYRAFGRTGLQVSELVFGGGFVGGILIHADDDTKLAALRRGLDGGMNWIDTAPSYGDGQSEEALGWLLKEVDAKPYLSTKVGLDLGRRRSPRPDRGEPGAEPEAPALRLGRSVPAAQPDRARDCRAHHRRWSRCWARAASPRLSSACATRACSSSSASPRWAIPQRFAR